MPLTGPLIHLSDGILARLVPLLLPTAAPVDMARTGLADVIVASDWNIDTDQGVSDFVSAFGSEPCSVILAPVDGDQEGPNDDKAQNALDIRFTATCKLAITYTSNEPGERLAQDLYLLPRVKELLVQWRPTEFAGTPVWGWQPIVVQNSQRYRIATMTVRILTFTVYVCRAATMMND